MYTRGRKRISRIHGSCGKRRVSWRARDYNLIFITRQSVYVCMVSGSSHRTATVTRCWAIEKPQPPTPLLLFSAKIKIIINSRKSNLLQNRNGHRWCHIFSPLRRPFFISSDYLTRYQCKTVLLARSRMYAW